MKGLFLLCSWLWAQDSPAELRASITVEGGQIQGDQQVQFEMEPIVVSKGKQTFLSLRIVSQVDQRVRIRLLDERLADVALLYNDLTVAGRPQLIKVGQGMPPGNYLLLAATESKRFGKSVEIK